MYIKKKKIKGKILKIFYYFYIKIHKSVIQISSSNTFLLLGGKLNPRELIEDKLKEIENKKKSPPKNNKKDLTSIKAEENTFSIEKKEKAFQNLLNKITPEEQYYHLK